MAPPPVAKLTDFAAMFTGAEAKSRQFATEYRRVADLFGCALLDASEVIVSSDLDGIHFDPEEHEKLGLAVAARVKAVVGWNNARFALVNGLQVLWSLPKGANMSEVLTPERVVEIDRAQSRFYGRHGLAEI